MSSDTILTIDPLTPHGVSVTVIWLISNLHTLVTSSAQCELLQILHTCVTRGSQNACDKVKQVYTANTVAPKSPTYVTCHKVVV